MPLAPATSTFPQTAMSYLNSTLLPQRGAHPVSTSIIHLVGTSRLYDACTLHLLYTLPPLLFVDTHELSQRDASYGFKHWGTPDLERPVHALPDEISELLLTVRLPEAGADSDAETVVQVDVPMHLRYGAPKAPESSGVVQTKPYLPLEVEWPQAFLRCPTRMYYHPYEHARIAHRRDLVQQLSQTMHPRLFSCQGMYPLLSLLGTTRVFCLPSRPTPAFQQRRGAPWSSRSATPRIYPSSSFSLH